MSSPLKIAFVSSYIFCLGEFDLLYGNIRIRAEGIAEDNCYAFLPGT